MEQKLSLVGIPSTSGIGGPKTKQAYSPSQNPHCLAINPRESERILLFVLAGQISVDVIVAGSKVVNVRLVGSGAGQFYLVAGSKGAHLETLFSQESVRFHRAVHVRGTNDRNRKGANVLVRHFGRKVQ